MTYLITGGAGSGKTRLAQRAAYLMCMNGLSFEDIDDYVDSIENSSLQGFIEGDRCLQIQITPTTRVEDFSTTAQVTEAEQRLFSLNRAIIDFVKRAELRTYPFAIIFDDLDRTDFGLFAGTLSSIFSNTEESSGSRGTSEFSVPANINVFITFSNNGPGRGLPPSFLSSLSGVKYVSQSSSQLEKHYEASKNSDCFYVAERLMEKTNRFIRDNSGLDYADEIESYFVPHSYFMVQSNDDAECFTEDLRNKYKYSVAPLLEQYYRQNILESDPADFVISATAEFTGKTKVQSTIAGVEKIYLRTNELSEGFSSQDAKAFLEEHISLGEKAIKARDIIELIIDSMSTNGLLPLDMTFSKLLTNQEVGWVENEANIGERASYLLSLEKANDFVYLTPKNGTKVQHNFFSTGSTRGRNSARGPVAYRYTYLKEAEPSIFVPLNGFRIKSFTVGDSKLYDDGNAAVAFRSCFRLLDAYLSLICDCYERMSRSDSSLTELAAYARVEMNYHRGIHEFIATEFSGKPENVRFYNYCAKLLNIRLIWEHVGETIAVNPRILEKLVQVPAVSQKDFKALHETSADQTRMTLREVEQMASPTDYQSVMDNLGIRQLIFQGPPGTSKTFESKKFVLSQLMNHGEGVSGRRLHRDDIEGMLTGFKLKTDDYQDPYNSKLLQKGGWDIVQFHPAYSYEDFIRGIQVSTENGVPIYETVNKIFGNIARLAKIAKSQSSDGTVPNFYLIIDEINRADLASVFGELIYGLEYRGSRMTTPYSVKQDTGATATFEFEVPDNLYLIGTMNTADRSIGSLDYAIRRRFLFIDSPADRDVIIESCRGDLTDEDFTPVELLFFDAVQYLFDSSEHFNDEYHRNDVRIGHTFFLRYQDDAFESRIADRIIYQVLPILREYVRDGILFPVRDRDTQSSERTFDQSDIGVIARQLLYFATTLGDAKEHTGSTEPEIRSWIMGVCADLRGHQ